MMLLKCCTQFASKFGKLGSGHRTQKGQFHSSPKKDNAKECSNYNTIVLILHASEVMLKVLKLAFNSMWFEKSQMYKLDFRKAEKP